MSNNKDSWLNEITIFEDSDLHQELFHDDFNFSVLFRSAIWSLMHTEKKEKGDFNEYIKNSKERRNKLRKIQNYDFKIHNYILFTSNTKLVVKSNKKFVHRIFSPILENLNFKFRVVLFGEEEFKNKFNSKWSFISKKLNIDRFKKDRYDNKCNQLTEDIFKIMEGLPSYINKANMCWNAELIAWTEKLWHELLKGKLPKVICLSSYLCPFNLGLIRIAKNYNIKVIELAHGKQGLFNPVYSHWGKNASENYNLVPDIFVTWRKDSQKIFEEKLGKKSIYSCNPLLMKYSRRKYQKKYISIFLQGPSNNIKIPLHVKDFITKNKDFTFAIKPHPGEEKPQYVNDLLKGNNVFLLNPNEDSYQLLLESYCALTSYSSIIQDCVDLNINCGVYGRQGLEVYKEEIENDLVFDFTESISLKEVIEVNPSLVTQSTEGSIEKRFERTISLITQLATTQFYHAKHHQILD